MDFVKKDNMKTYEYVFEYFFQQILSGELCIGDKIPPERVIAESLGVSRNSIREVMHMMEINGLIDCQQGSGNYVKCNPQEYLLKTVNMVMALMDIKYIEVYHMRTGFEMVAFKLAIQEATEEEKKEMYDILCKMEENVSPEESAYWDAEFHNHLIKASHNRMLILFASLIGDFMNQFVSDFRERILEDTEKGMQLQRAHWNIYDAIIEKDYISGSAALNKHFDIIGEQIRQMNITKAEK